jgi:hypothetical protein
MPARRIVRDVNEDARDIARALAKSEAFEREFAGMKTLVKGQLLTYNTAPARDGRLKAVDLRLLSR